MVGGFCEKFSQGANEGYAVHLIKK